MGTTSPHKENAVDLNEYSGYLIDKMRLLEERNNILREQKEKIEWLTFHTSSSRRISCLERV